MAQQDYTGVNPLAALFSGIVQGGATQYINMQEEERKSQFNAAKILLEAGINTGELKALTGLVDPKILKSWGLTPETIEPFHQMLEPRRQELASMRALREAQAGLAGAQTRYVGTQEQIGAAQAEETRQKALAIPRETAVKEEEAAIKGRTQTLKEQTEPIEAEAKREAARASMISAGAAATQARAAMPWQEHATLMREQMRSHEKIAETTHLDLNDRKQLEELKNANRVLIEDMKTGRSRETQGAITSRTEMVQEATTGRMREQQGYIMTRQSKLQADKLSDDALITAYKEAGDRLTQAKTSIDKISAKDPKGKDTYIQDPGQYAQQIEDFNNATEYYNGIGQAYQARFGTPHLTAPLTRVSPTPVPGTIFGMKAWTKGHLLEPVMTGQAPGAAAPVESPESQSIRERAKQIRKGQ